MNKNDKLAADALFDRKEVNLGNTSIRRHLDSGYGLFLFGNLIAVYYDNGDLEITNAGWATNTTKNRLNALGANITQKKGQWYLNGELWDGSWAKLILSNLIPKE